mgnify:CR=1 FL=1
MSFKQRFSDLAGRLNGDDSGVWAVSDKASELQMAGKDVIKLCVGDPDFDTPAPIHDAVASSLKAGRTHYSPSQGELELRSAIADLETRTSRHPCSPEDVVIFPGATNALYTILSCLMNTGDELIVPEPMYVGYVGFLAAVGVKVKHVPLNSERNFALEIDAIKACINSKTKAVLVNTPGNPAGNMMTREEMAELALFCYERNVWLICDEVYSMITYNRRHVSMRSAATSLDNIIMVDGLSKSHAMSGWRIGWAVAPPALVPHLVNFAGATVFGCTQFVQDAAAWALRHDEYYMSLMREEYQRRRDFLVERFNQMEGLSCQSPDAGMFVMVKVCPLFTSGKEFAEGLVDTQFVSVVPGEGFGPSAKEFVRVTLAQPVEILADACDRIETYIKSVKPSLEECVVDDSQKLKKA